MRALKTVILAVGIFGAVVAHAESMTFTCHETSKTLVQNGPSGKMTPDAQLIRLVIQDAKFNNRLEIYGPTNDVGVFQGSHKTSQGTQFTWATSSGSEYTLTVSPGVHTFNSHFQQTQWSAINTVASCTR